MEYRGLGIELERRWPEGGSCTRNLIHFSFRFKTIPKNTFSGRNHLMKVPAVHFFRTGGQENSPKVVQNNVIVVHHPARLLSQDRLIAVRKKNIRHGTLGWP